MSLESLKILDNNGVRLYASVPDYETCTVSIRHDLAHPKTADHKAKLDFPLGFANLMVPLFRGLWGATSTS